MPKSAPEDDPAPSPAPSFAAYAPRPRGGPAAAVLPGLVLAEASRARLEELAELQVTVRGGSAAEWAGRIGRVLDDEQGVIVAAEAAGTVVAYASAQYLPACASDQAPAGYYLTGVSVAPAWRRRGTGTALTRWRMTWIWGRAAEVWCFISLRNLASVDLHERLGFCWERTGPGFQGVRFDGGQGVLLRARR
jgi:phosphinothricin acetyltransferase